MTFNNWDTGLPDALQTYKYDHDANGNRLFARIKQADHNNDNSYLYGYDPLNRLRFAERGVLNGTNDTITGQAEGQYWKLDLLGNWSGDGQAVASFVRYHPDGPRGYLDPVPAPLTYTEHHQTFDNNQITARKIDIDGDDSTYAIQTSSFSYDGGNLTDDGTHLYEYDAWNRLTRVVDKATNESLSYYVYDVFGRRIRKSDHTADDAGTYFTPTEYYYYDGDRVIDIYRTVVEGDPTPGDFDADQCTSGGDEGGGGRPPASKRISDADTGATTGVVLTKYTPQTQDTGAADQASKSQASEKRSMVAFAEAPVTELRPLRRFVYGLDYINEVVAQITPDTEDGTTTVTPVVRYVLQDANYNVVSIARECDGALIRQFRYSPYGELEAIEDGDGNPLASDTSVDAWHLFQGMFYNRETRDPNTEPEHFGGQYSVGPRIYAPDIGRYLQRDPNETALILSNVLAMNGQTRYLSASLYASMQYNDGMNLYGFVRNNPMTGHDPTGLYGEFDYFFEGDEIELELTGQKLYTLGVINEGARWASLGLQTTLDITGALLGVDVFQSVAVIASGRGGFWDSMNIFLSVAPFGSLGKAGGKLFKTFKTVRRAGKGSRLARSAARHLFKILPYNQAQKLTKGWGGDIMAHHILEGRHLKAWKRSGEIATAPAVILTRKQHGMITKELQRRLKYGVDHTDKDKVKAVYKEVYTRFGFQEWLEHIEKYFR